MKRPAGKEMRDRRREAANAGFTMIELMVALSVFAVVLTMTLSAQMTAEKSRDRGVDMVNANQNGRVALDLISRDIRMAGSGVGNVPIDVSFRGRALVRWPVTPLPSFAAQDSVELMGGQRFGSSTLATALVLAEDPIDVNDSNGFAVGDMIVIATLNRGYLLQVTGLDDEGRLLHAETSPWNQLGDNWPAGGFPTGSRVTRVEYVRYYIDQTDPVHPVLMRWHANETDPSFVAKDVETLSLEYVEGNATVPNPADPLNIRAIRITATTVAGDVQDPHTPRRPLVTTVVPRILN